MNDGSGRRTEIRVGQWLNGIWFDQETIDQVDQEVAAVEAERRIHEALTQSPEPRT